MRPAEKRRRWLEARRERGLLRPDPVDVLMINTASVSYRPARAKKIWSRAVEVGADVILACEMADVDATPTRGYRVYQERPVGSPNSALAIAIRKDRGRIRAVRLLEGSKATSEGGGIRDRPILKADLTFDPGSNRRWSRSAAAEHAPPSRAPKARADYLKDANAAAIIGGDLNIRRRWALRLFYGKRVHSSGVIHLAIPRWIPQSEAELVDIGSDHKAIKVTLWPK